MIVAIDATFEDWQAFANQKGIPRLTNSSTDNEWNCNLSLTQKPSSKNQTIIPRKVKTGTEKTTND